MLRRLGTGLALRPFDDLTLLLCIGVGAAFWVAHWTGFYALPDYTARGVVILAALSALVAIDQWEARRWGQQTPERAAVLLIFARIALVEGVVLLDGFGVSSVLYLIVPMKAFVYFPASVAYGFSLSVLAFYFVRLSLYKPDWYTSTTAVYTFVLFVVGILLTSTTARLFSREQRSRIRAEQLLEEVESSRQRLARYAQRAAEAAALEERNRLAREIHDSLGHYLTAINIQLEKAMVFAERKPDEAAQAVRDAKRLSNEALEDVRQSVSALRDTGDGFALLPALERLAETARSSRLDVRLDVAGGESGFSNQARLALYRAAQEAVTNIQRHARATCADIVVRFEAERAALTVRDNGVGFDPTRTERAQQGSIRSYGLTGVRERLELVGGQLRIESAAGKGTTLTIQVPKDYATLPARGESG